jgi:ribosomal protein L24
MTNLKSYKNWARMAFGLSEAEYVTQGDRVKILAGTYKGLSGIIQATMPGKQVSPLTRASSVYRVKLDNDKTIDVKAKSLRKIGKTFSEQSKEKDKDKSGEEGGLAHGNTISPKSPERDVPEPEPFGGSAPPSPPGGTAAGAPAAGQQPGQQPGEPQQVGAGDPEKEKEKEKELDKINNPPAPKAKTTLGKYIVKHLTEEKEYFIGSYISNNGRYKVKFTRIGKHMQSPIRVVVMGNKPGDTGTGEIRNVVKPSQRAAKEFAKKYLKEIVSPKWKREAEIPAMSHGGGNKVGRDPGKTYVSDTEPSGEMIKIIDKNDKKVLAFAKKAFDSKPYGLAMRLIERYLERLGIPNSLSGDIADVLAKAFKKDTDPESQAYRKVQSRILPPNDPLRNVTPDYLQGM